MESPMVTLTDKLLLKDAGPTRYLASVSFAFLLRLRAFAVQGPDV